LRSADERRVAHGQGIIAERVAIIVLRLKFYSILARRYSIRGGEIDIVARRGDTIAFVEVKIRPSLDEARAAITPAKRRRLSRAASVWLAANPYAAGFTLRGDAVFVAPWRWPRHVRAAIELENI
jgi:putative endonuclease